MRLQYRDLPKDLAKQIRRVYVITGDEPMQKIDARDRIRQTARQLGFADRYDFQLESGIDEGLWQQAFAGDSLFSRKAMVELSGQRLPNKQEQRLLETWAPNLTDDMVLIVDLPKIDRKTERSKWFSTLTEHGVWIAVWPVPLDALPHFLIEQAAWHQRKLEPDAAARMAEWVDGNLLAARQTLAQLVFMTKPGDTIHEDLVEAYCSDNARFTPWQTIDAALEGKADRLPRLLQRLSETDVAPMLMARGLQNTLRQLTSLAECPAAQRSARMQTMGIWRPKQSLYMKALQRWPATVWPRLLIRAYHLEAMIVGARQGAFWDACLDLCLIIAGKRIGVPYDSQ